MNNETVDQIVLAGLLHDIGKLLERGDVFAEARNDPHYLTFCKDSKGHPTHLHAAHTARFCDWLEERFDCLRKDSDKNWKTWCAAHHRDDESGFEASVIRIADRLSSSEREVGEYYRRNIHKKTLLEPVLERVLLQENTDNTATHHRLPLVRLGLRREEIFPQGAGEMGLAVSDHPEAVCDPSEWDHLMAKEPLTEAYRALSEGLMEELKTLAKRHPQMKLTDLTAWLTAFLEMYTVNVPSATNVRHPDITLFDHLRTTAAIAQGLYLFQKERSNQKIDIESKTEPKWILVCGDFSGIQKFIYNLTNKGAAKGLRGRSFYVQLFCRIACDFILRQAGLNRAAVLYNSGGKFYLLAPSNAWERILDARKRINEWLLQEFYGSVFLGIGMSPVTGEMFEQGKMSTAWKEVAEALERDRLTRFRENLNPAFFEPDTSFNPVESCSVCGSRILQKDADTCESCHRLKDIGTWIKDMDAVLVVWGGTTESDRIENVINTKTFFRIDPLEVSIFLVSKRTLRELSGIRNLNAECILLADIVSESGLSGIDTPACALSMMALGKWDSDRDIRSRDGEEWDFEDYANHAVGIQRLGILRMDVDNLGSVFIEGLRWPERSDNGWGKIVLENGRPRLKTMASISRMATLSRQLHWFFAGYVPTLLDDDRFNRCQIVYAGGDDLFVIGSWDQLPTLAETIREDFRRFCCYNPDMSISGGITLHGGKFPIYKGAQMAGDAERQAKSVRKEWYPEEKELLKKDGFCFLGIPIVWEDMDAARVLLHLLVEEVKGDRGWLGYLIQMTAANQFEAERTIKAKKISTVRAWQELAYQSWRWRTAYQLKRRFGKDDGKIQMWANILFNDRYDDHDPNRETTLPVYSWLALPLRWTDYLHRTKGGK